MYLWSRMVGLGSNRASKTRTSELDTLKTSAGVCA